MSNCFLKQGNRYHVSSREAMNLHDTLPPTNFIVKFDPMKGFFLEEIPAFATPAKVYGTCDTDTDRVLATFEHRASTTGVLLAGEKGSGKTLFSKMVSVKAAKKGLPTIAVTSDFVGEDFNTFLQMIEQPCVIFFDEFEKVYDKEKQENILTLLDGVFNSAKLFLFTCNDSWRIDIHMRNRPGRIFYALNFTGIDRAFIEAYCEDRLEDLSQVDTVCTVAMMFAQFNFDMLQALVEEMNRYGESAHDALRMLNVKPENQGEQIYSVRLVVDGRQIPDGDVSDDGRWEGNPLSKNLSIGYAARVGDENKWSAARFSIDDLKRLDHARGEFVFKNPLGQELTIIKESATTVDFRNLLV